jgi:hypothetical protein
LKMLGGRMGVSFDEKTGAECGGPEFRMPPTNSGTDFVDFP